MNFYYVCPVGDVVSSSMLVLEALKGRNGDPVITGSTLYYLVGLFLLLPEMGFPRHPGSVVYDRLRPF